MDFSSKRVKLSGAILAVVLVAVGVIALNHTQGAQQTHLEHAEAIARMKGANTPMQNLPDESQVETPHGWAIESDEPIEGVGSEEELAGEDSEDDLEQEGMAVDDDIDSPLQMEQDASGRQFVAELDPAVMVSADEKGAQAESLIAADGKGYNRCFKNLKTCTAKRKCTRKCTKKCHPYAVRKCKNKKFCRCFCKFQKNYRLAKKCVVYKKKTCTKGVQYRCKRDCKKFCKKVPHCYCCPLTRVRQTCRKLCKRIMYKSKCARCKCAKLKCYDTCRFVCLKKY